MYFLYKISEFCIVIVDILQQHNHLHKTQLDTSVLDIVVYFPYDRYNPEAWCIMVQVHFNHLDKRETLTHQISRTGNCIFWEQSSMRVAGGRPPWRLSRCRRGGWSCLRCYLHHLLAHFWAPVCEELPLGSAGVSGAPKFSSKNSKYFHIV